MERQFILAVHRNQARDRNQTTIARVEPRALPHVVEQYGIAYFSEARREVAPWRMHRDRPAGSIRITTGEHPARTILAPALARLLPMYPEIKVELSVNAGFIDIVAERFDAGVRLGETIAQDMVALRIGPDLSMAAVASPAYLVGRDPPRAPQDLALHGCINMRFPTYGGLYAWEFEKAGRALNVRVDGQLTVNDTALALQAALEGLGVAYLPEDYVLAAVGSGHLIRLLDEWCPPFPGYHLYDPSRRQHSAAFALLVEALRFREAA